jgi:hypothetical protein
MVPFFGALGTTEVVPFPVVPLPKSLEVWSRGIPRLTKDARRGAPARFVAASAHSRFLNGLSARFGMTKNLMGLRHD